MLPANYGLALCATAWPAEVVVVFVSLGQHTMGGEPGVGIIKESLQQQTQERPSSFLEPPKRLLRSSRPARFNDVPV